MKRLKLSVASMLFLTCFHIAIAGDYSIVDFGAKSDGVSICTDAIQKAIDECGRNGGGTVVVPAGTFISGTLYLKSNVEFHLNNHAVIQGSTIKKDYTARTLVMCDSIENASITGDGMLYGSGDHEVFQASNKDRVRPHILFVQNSRCITIKGVTLKHAAYWALRIFGSENVVINGIRIYNHGATNNDGIDIDGKDIVVSDCLIDSEDDALCFKSDRSVPCENVVVTNCVLASDCNAIKMGTSGKGGFKNIAISNCVIHRAAESSPSQKWKTKVNATSDTTVISGIALEMVDGGTMDQITISNVSMTGVQTPIFIRLGKRSGSKGTLKNILISNVAATTESFLPSSITGIPGNDVENIILRDIVIQCLGLGALEDAKKIVPEKDTSYPENRMYGKTLPAYGLYVRHVKNLSLNNIQIKLLHPDARPAMIFDDVDYLNVNQFRLDPSEQNQSMVWLKQVTNAAISGYSSPQALDVFATVEGDRSSRIHFIGNDFSNVRKVWESADVKDEAVRLMNNILK